MRLPAALAACLLLPVCTVAHPASVDTAVSKRDAEDNGIAPQVCDFENFHQFVDEYFTPTFRKLRRDGDVEDFKNITITTYTQLSMANATSPANFTLWGTASINGEPIKGETPFGVESFLIDRISKNLYIVKAMQSCANKSNSTGSNNTSQGINIFTTSNLIIPIIPEPTGDYGIDANGYGVYDVHHNATDLNKEQITEILQVLQKYFPKFDMLRLMVVPHSNTSEIPGGVMKRCGNHGPHPMPAGFAPSGRQGGTGLPRWARFLIALVKGFIFRDATLPPP